VAVGVQRRIACCAYAARGQATEPPNKPKNSLRFIFRPTVVRQGPTVPVINVKLKTDQLGQSRFKAFPQGF